MSALASLCTRENTDTTIQCGQEKFFCHSILLRARSLVFYKLLDGGNNVICVDGVNPDTMNDIIKYVYTATLEISREKVAELVAAAVKFQLPALIEKCVKVFSNQINFDNALEVLQVAEKLEMNALKELCLQKITQNRSV